MAGLIQAVRSWFSGHQVKASAPRGHAAARPANESAPEAPDLSLEVTRLHAWLMGCQRIVAGERSIPERAMLTELRQRIRNRRLSRIPRQPRVLPVLIRALGDERQTHRDIAAIILDEPALTDELLRVVNRCRGRESDQRPVESVEQAVLMVGFEGVRRAVSEAVMRPVMQGQSRAEADFARRVWHWGLLCANACDLVAQQQRRTGPDLFMIGLMPALAYLTLYREFESIAHDHTGSREVPPSMLDEVLHDEVGHMLERLIEAWQLPARYGRHLEELHGTPLGRAESTLSKGMVLGTRETLLQAGRQTLLQGELLRVTRLDPRLIETVQARLKADPATGH